LVAFIIQSLIAVVVSGYTWILSSTIQQRWNEAAPAQETHHSDDKAQEWLRSFHGKWMTWLDSVSSKRIARNAYLKSMFNRLLNLNGEKPSGKAFEKGSQIWAWLIGKQPEQPRQRVDGSKIEDEITPTTRRLKCADRILLAGSDTQTFTGN
jgi:hypothetical protein